MKFELPTWAYAAVASAGIMCGSTYLALRPAETASLEHAVERDFPDARPAPKGLAEQAQKLFDEKKYAFGFAEERHEISTCEDRDRRPLLDCATHCPEKPSIHGTLIVDGKAYSFTAVADRIALLNPGKLSTVDGSNAHYAIYWWGDIRDQKHDGPYKYDHGRKTWQKVQPWWPARKNQ